MAKYVVIECNRQNSQSNYGNLDESEDIYKNLWVNNVSTTGIQVESGDTISCVSAAINNVGASDEVMEFIGNTQQGFLDNKLNIEAGYYVNHTGRNTGMLPFTNMKTINGFLGVTDSKRQNNYFRNLGAPDLRDYGSDIITNNYVNQLSIPNDSLLFRMTADDPAGEGYKVGDVVSTWTLSPATSSGQSLVIKITEITNETATAIGIPTKFIVISVGRLYSVNDKLTAKTAPAGGKPIILTIKAYPNVNFCTKNYEGQPDGGRYFFGNLNYTGALSKYDGIPETDREDTDLLDNNFNIRKFDIDLEVPIGFNTPDNIGGILTDILHKPIRYNGVRQEKDNWQYIIPEKVIVESVNTRGLPLSGAPNIIQTPTWQPIGCNANGEVVATNTLNTLTGSLHSFYSMCAWEQPDRLKWLGQLNSLYFGLNVLDVKNEIFTGRASTIINNIGDFGNQSIGEYSILPRLLNNMVFDTLPNPNDPTQPYKYMDEVNKQCVYQKGGWLVTTIYYTEEMVKKIADILHNTEEYWGDKSQVVNPESSDYNLNLASILDLGKYQDEQSQCFPPSITDPASGSFDPSTPFDQRLRYTVSNKDRSVGAYQETATWGNNVTFPTRFPLFNIQSDSNFGQRLCTGDQQLNNNFIGTDGLNDGFQLSQIVVSSRWTDDYLPPSVISEGDIDENLPYTNTYNSCFGDFNLPFSNNVNTSFRSTYNGTTYDEMIGWAKKYDVAVIPVYPQPNNQIGTSEYITFPDSKGIGRPFLAFRSHLEIGGDEPMDRIKNTGKWKIDAGNCLQGTFIGYDPSFIRNKAVQVFNLQHPSPNNYDKNSSYNPIMYIGAVNPSLEYSPLLSRFEITGLNTPMTLGNGKQSDFPNFQDANDDPEQVVYNNSVTGAIMPFFRSYFNLSTGALADFDYIHRDQLGIVQRSDTLLGSQSGIAITGISLYKTNSLELIPLSNTDYGLYINCLFHKMGFDLNQFLPIFGNSQAIFVSKLPISQINRTYLEAIENTVKPVTTGAYISSAEFQPLSLNQKNYPMYDLGGDTLISVQPAVNQANLVGQRLPQKLDFPYLCVYSSIVSSGTDTLYIGSGNGHQLIPCMAFITRNYSSGDFFYGLEQSFSYTATKNFTITDITTDIRLPDGTRPQLQPHSSVIYKITKPQNSLPSVMPTETKKIISNNNIHNDDKDRRDRIKKAI
mgnify:CR=1 FL=1